jgi:hypothetical protein
MFSVTELVEGAKHCTLFSSLRSCTLEVSTSSTTEEFSAPSGFQQDWRLLSLHYRENGAKKIHTRRHAFKRFLKPVLFILLTCVGLGYGFPHVGIRLDVVHLVVIHDPQVS